jgi:hypothetical protein
MPFQSSDLIRLPLRHPGLIFRVRPGISRIGAGRTGNQSHRRSHRDHVFQQRQRQVWGVKPPPHASPPGIAEQRSHQGSGGSQRRSGAGIVAVRDRKCRSADTARDQPPRQGGRPEPAGGERGLVADNLAQRQLSCGAFCQTRIEQGKRRIAQVHASSAGRPTNCRRSGHGAETSYQSDAEGAKG